MSLPLTDAELERVAYYVRNLIRKESKGVHEVNLVNTLDGIESFPTIQYFEGIPRIVRAPIKLLSEPAWEAVKELITKLDESLSKAENAAANADRATDKAYEAIDASETQRQLCLEATRQALDIIGHPPIVGDDNILYTYDPVAGEYISTGHNMKGATFTPFYDETDGKLYWSNDQGLPNPEPVRVEGNVMFATFRLPLENTDEKPGHLIMRTMDEYKGAGFKVKNGRLTVVI